MNLEDYVGLALQVITNSIPPERGYNTAATLGARLRSSVTEATWTDFGYSSLTDFLRVLEGRQLLTLFHTSKDALAVRLGPPAPDSAAPPPPATYNPLRKQVWVAFVVALPAGRRFINRRTGMVRLAQQTAPAPLDEWAEVSKISDQVQVGWARTFLDEAGFNSPAAVSDALGSPNWYQAFPRELANHDRGLRIRWNRVRTTRVAQCVEHWAEQHDVSRHLLFQVDGADTRDEAAGATAPLATSVPDGDQRREWILAALAELPLEKLLEISVPAGLLFNAMQGATRAR